MLTSDKVSHNKDQKSETVVYNLYKLTIFNGFKSIPQKWSLGKQYNQ